MWHSLQSSDGYSCCIFFTQSLISFFEVPFSISSTSMAFRKKNGLVMNLLLAIEFLRRFFQWEYICGWINIYTLVNSILCITIPSLRKQPFLLALCRCGRFARPAKRRSQEKRLFSQAIPYLETKKQNKIKRRIKLKNKTSAEWNEAIPI